RAVPGAGRPRQSASGVRAGAGARSRRGAPAVRLPRHDRGGDPAPALAPGAGPRDRRHPGGPQLAHDRPPRLHRHAAVRAGRRGGADLGGDRRGARHRARRPPSPAPRGASALSVAASPQAAEASAWVKCPACDAFVYAKRLVRNLKVCPECNHHFRLPAQERLTQLLDPGSFEDLSGDIESVAVPGFPASKPHPKRLDEARRKTGRRDAALYGKATINELPVVVAIMDFTFMGGSMGGAVGEAVTRAAELALETRTPLIIVSSSGGARMQEGCVSLMQMAKTSAALARLHEEGVLCINVLADPTYGGVTASFAVLGDILVAEPRALVGFAGPAVIEQTIRQKLPAGFQTAEFLMEHGMLDLVEPRENLRNALRKILAIHQGGNEKLPDTEGLPPVTDADGLAKRPTWDVVE